MQTPHSPRTYHHWIQETIREIGDQDARRLRLLVPELEIPRSTIRSWIRRGAPNVVHCGLASCDRTKPAVEIRELRRRTAVPGATVGLLTAMLQISKVRFN